MKLRTFSVLFLGAGLLVLLAGVGLPFLFTSAEVIGGADGPSLRFLVYFKLHGAPIALGLLGAATMLSAAVSLVFSGTIKGNCTPGTSALALGLSTCVSAGLVCALEFVACFAFGSLEQHPVAVPVSVFGGGIAFFALWGLGWLYWKRRKLSPSGKGVLLDVLTAVAYLPGTFYTFCCLEGFLSELI